MLDHSPPTPPLHLFRLEPRHHESGVQALLDETNRLFSVQKIQIEERFAESEQKLDSRFTDRTCILEQWFSAVDEALTKRIADVDDSLNKHLIEVDDSITKRLADSDLAWERCITDSELRQNNLLFEAEQRQDERVISLAKTAGELESWRQASESAVDDLKLKVDKLTKYWGQTLLDNASALTRLISPPPQPSEQTAARLLRVPRLLSPAGTTSK
jgi:dGTP triphosphohydrolase